MKVKVNRWPMCGGGVAYSVRVPVDEAPAFLRDRCPKGSNSYVTQVGESHQGERCHGYFFDYPHATISESHHDAEQGWDKYQAWLTHEKKANAEMLALIQRHFPETVGLTEFPLLWATGLFRTRDEEKNCAMTVWDEVDR